MHTLRVIETILLILTAVILAFSCMNVAAKNKKEDNTDFAITVLTTTVISNVIAVVLIWQAV